MRWLLPDEAEELLKRRWQIINVGTFTKPFYLFGGIGYAENISRSGAL